MNRALKLQLAWMGCALVAALGPTAPPDVAAAGSTPAPQLMLAQAMVPRTGMMDAEHPMPMKERMLKRFPQPVRVGDIIGLPVLDMRTSSTLGYVREVVRTPEGDVELIVSYSPWWGWFGHPVAVPIEAVGIEGRQIVSLDMSPQEYAKTARWVRTNETIFPEDATISIPLSRS
jgi:hypothetical protein